MQVTSAWDAATQWHGFAVWKPTLLAQMEFQSCPKVTQLGLHCQRLEVDSFGARSGRFHTYTTIMDPNGTEQWKQHWESHW